MLGTFVWSWSGLHYKAFLYRKALNKVFSSIIKHEGTETQLVYAEFSSVNFTAAKMC